MKTSNELPTMSRLGIVFLTWRRYLQRRILPYGVTLKQHYVLRSLQKHETLSPSHIAELLFCDRPTATFILNTMKKNEWIASQKDPRNLKQREISLTAKGRETLASLSGFYPDSAFEPLSCFTDDERMQFDALLRKLHQHLKTIPQK